MAKAYGCPNAVVYPIADSGTKVKRKQKDRPKAVSTAHVFGPRARPFGSQGGRPAAGGQQIARPARDRLRAALVAIAGS